jgi:diguanylate cyclase (GGDEF)-like protein
MSVSGFIQTARTNLLAIGVMALVALMGLSAVVGFLTSASDLARLREERLVTRQLREFQQALVDAETGVRGFVLTGKVEYLEPYIAGTRVLDAQGEAAVDELEAQAGGGNAGLGHAATVLTELRQTWRAAIDLAENDRLSDAQALLVQKQAKPLMDGMRHLIISDLDARTVAASDADRRLTLEQNLLLLINPIGALIAFAATGFAFWRSSRDAQARELAQQEMRTLFEMTEMLQSAGDREDANAVLRATAQKLLPGFAGTLYVFNNSRDRLDLSTRWGKEDETGIPDHIGPQACWALKRGKPHVNHAGTGLTCAHPGLGEATLDIPMTARGELYGLLQIGYSGPAAGERLSRILPLANALGDAMSLSLSSNALRDRLRNQALRDGLTGLYNRRFLEEMLERLTQDAHRRGVPLSAVMIDLDHFKRLNDQFGHATGDAVLQEVAQAILTNLRSADVACRYGGEELLLLLPDCDMDTALAKAENLRTRIKELGGNSVGQPVTASFGVATIPTSAAQGAELLAAADAALYRSKQHGRDRVTAAPPRNGTPHVSLVQADRI